MAIGEFNAGEYVREFVGSFARSWLSPKPEGAYFDPHYGFTYDPSSPVSFGNTREEIENLNAADRRRYWDFRQRIAKIRYYEERRKQRTNPAASPR